ncbi:MAG: hypothetical protein ACK4ZE_00240 [Sphingorhabdus sp.]
MEDNQLKRAVDGAFPAQADQLLTLYWRPMQDSIKTTEKRCLKAYTPNDSDYTVDKSFMTTMQSYHQSQYCIDR